MLQRLPDEMKLKICNILPANGNYGDNTLCVATEDNGNFVVRTVYRQFTQTDIHVNNDTWKRVWTLKVS